MAPNQTMTAAPCVISVAEHAGWAHLVSVGASGSTPVVLLRRRLTLIDAGLPTLPYHHDTLPMLESEANALIARVKRSIAACTARELRRVVSELAPTHHAVALAIREPVFPELPASVADVRRSYRLQCAADGVMYQMEICRAAHDLGLDVYVCARRGEIADAAERLGVTEKEIEAFLSSEGRPPGPPWTAEHRRAYAAGIAALTAHVRTALRITSSERAYR